MCFGRKQKNWPAALKRRLFFHGTHLAQRSWQMRTRLKSIFPWGRPLILSRYWSWVVGRESRKLSILKSTRCLAQGMLRSLLASEVHYLLKVWSFSDWIAVRSSTPEHNQEASLPLVLEGRKLTWKSRVLNVRSENFCWLKHPGKHLTHNIKMQRTESSGHFHGFDLWFLSVKCFPKFQLLNRYSEARTSCLLFFFEELWCGRLEVKLKTGRKTHRCLKTELLKTEIVLIDWFHVKLEILWQTFSISGVSCFHSDQVNICS